MKPLTKPLRRTQAERTEEMRARLAEAAFGVVASRGLSAFRTAAVAEAAEVSQGALLHHFPTKDDITLAAIEFALARAEQASRTRLSQSFRDTAAVLDAMFEDFREFFLGDNFWVTLDITLGASKGVPLKSAIRKLVAAYRVPVYDAWTDKLCAYGIEKKRAILIIRSLIALVTGDAVRSLWTSDDDVSKQLYAMWRENALQST